MAAMPVVVRVARAGCARGAMVEGRV